MIDESAPSLNLERVVQRFVESEDVLRELEGKIRSLAGLEERTETSTEQLQESASALANFAAETGQLTAQLAEVSNTSQQLLTKAHEVLDESQLQRIEDRLGQNRSAFEEKLASHETVLKNLQSSVRDVDEALTKTESRLLTELDQTDELRAVRESVGQVTSEMGSTLHERMAPIEKRLSDGTRRVTWLLSGVLFLQIAILVLVVVRGA